MEKRRCQRCQKALPYGSLVYTVQVRVFADFDGVIIDPEEEGTPSFKELLEQVEQADPQELEKEIYEEYRLTLCKRCRDRFVQETRHPYEGEASLLRHPGSLLH